MGKKWVLTVGNLMGFDKGTVLCSERNWGPLAMFIRMLFPGLCVIVLLSLLYGEC